jgi:nitrogen fixation NifU-like protein
VDALYQKQILALAKQSRDSVYDSQAPYTASCDNPVCGDRVDLSFDIADGKLHNLGVKVRGCALCEAGAGLAVASLDGVPAIQLAQVTAEFASWLGKGHHKPPLDDMVKFMPVRDIRNRHKCVLLAFHTATAALDRPAIDG